MLSVVWPKKRESCAKILSDSNQETIAMKTNGEKITEYFKDFNPWPRIRKMGSNIGQDSLAGITVAFIALPLALGFGVASGLGAITGIWGAIAGGLVGGLFGGSNVGVSGPTGPKTIQLATVMHEHMLENGQPDLVFAFGIVFLSGVIMLGLAAMGVGKFIYLTPYSVISGFMCGIGAIVIIIEFNPFVGLPTMSSVKEALIAIPSSIAHAHLDALFISSLTLLTIVVWPKITKSRMVARPSGRVDDWDVCGQCLEPGYRIHPFCPYRTS